MSQPIFDMVLSLPWFVFSLLSLFFHHRQNITSKLPFFHTITVKIEKEHFKHRSQLFGPPAKTNGLVIWIDGANNVQTRY